MCDTIALNKQKAHRGEMRWASFRLIIFAKGMNSMRFILATTILAILAQPVFAVTNEYLYKACKPFAERGFSLSEDQLWNDGICVGYIAAAIEQAEYLCQLTPDYEDITSSWPDGDAARRGLFWATLLFGASATTKDLNAVVQSFLNWAEQNPADWQYHPKSTYWLASKFPCKQ